MSDVKKEGWGWLFNSTKWHYFRDGHSLCGHWMIFGSGSELKQGNDKSTDNCKQCMKKILKEKETVE